MPEPVLIPDFNWKKEYIIGGIEELNNHLDFVLDKIYNFESCFTHNIKLLNLDRLTLDIHYQHSSYRNWSIAQFDIRNKYDNPFRKIESNEEIRVKK